MAFRKGTPQAQKGKAKGPAAGKKTPQKMSIDQLDNDDFDEDDDMDFLNDSGADEDLDDEELDDEELDDEELDDEEDEQSEDEEAPAGTARGQQQGTPVRVTVNGKRKAEDQPGPSSAKKVCLQDHIPAGQVVDYEERDLCDVKLADFAASVTEQDVKNLCKDAVEVRFKHFRKKLSCAFVRYADKDKATAAVQALKEVKLKGQPFSVQYCGTRWADPATCPQQLTNTLDVRGLPKSLQDKKKLATLYPTGQVVKVFSDGYAQVRFPSADALVKAVKDPKGRIVGKTELRLSIALDFKGKQPRGVGNKPPPSTQRGAGQKKSRARSSVRGRPGQKGTPGAKSSPKTPQQQKGKSPGQKGSTPAKKVYPKTPAKLTSPKTAGKQQGPKTPGQAKGGAATPKSANKGTPFQKKTPKGTPGKA